MFNLYTKKIRYLTEFIFLFLFVRFLQLFPIWLASNISGFIFRYLLYFALSFTGDNKRGIKQIGFVFPHMGIKERKRILRSSYENIGRLVAEYVNQYKMTNEWFEKNVEVDKEYFLSNLRSGCFPFTAHFGNWEVMQRFLYVNDIKVSVVYNPLRNPYINKFYLKQRRVVQLPKGTNSMKQLIEAIKLKKTVGILIDQRDKMGEIYKFFDHDARTSTAIQRLCVRYGYEMTPVICLRNKENPNKFVLTALPALKTDEKDIEKAVADMTNQSLRILESWIRGNPENWLLWFYSRWRTKF